MSAKYLAAIALVAFVLTSSARIYVTNAQSAGSSPTAINAPPADAETINGRTLFLRNCAHCHGADAHGDDGPDLHDLGLSDKWITNRIRKGKAGEMTAFGGKLQSAQITALVTYVQSLK